MQSEPVIRETELTEQQERILSKANTLTNRHNWELGELAHEWKEFGCGSDGDFADLSGNSRQAVNFARNIYDRFGAYEDALSALNWKEWKALLSLQPKDLVDRAVSSVAVMDDGFRIFPSIISTMNVLGKPDGVEVRNPLLPMEQPPEEEFVATPGAETQTDDENCVQDSTAPDGAGDGGPDDDEVFPVLPDSEIQTESDDSDLPALPRTNTEYTAENRKQHDQGKAGQIATEADLSDLTPSADINDGVSADTEKLVRGIYDAMESAAKHLLNEQIRRDQRLQIAAAFRDLAEKLENAD